MNGGAQSGADAAKAVMAALSDPKAAAGSTALAAVADDGVTHATSVTNRRSSSSDIRLADERLRHAPDIGGNSCSSWLASRSWATPGGPIAIGCRCQLPADNLNDATVTPAYETAAGAAGPPRPGSHPSGRRRHPAVAGRASCSRIMRRGIMRVGMEPDAPPLHFINDRKQEEGFDFRLAGIVAEGIGAKRVQIVEADYEELPDLVRDGNIDLIIGGYVPDPSIEGVEWSNGYLDFGLCMIVPRAWSPHHVARRSRRQERRDLRRPGRRALGQGQYPQRHHQQVLGRRRLVRGGGETTRRRADLRLPVRGQGNQSASAHGHRQAQPQSVEVRRRHSQGNYDLIFEVNRAIDQIKATPQYADLMREYLSSTSEVFMKPVAGRKTYVVKAGDTLTKIAQRTRRHGALEGHLGAQSRPRRQREPDLPQAGSVDAVRIEEFKIEDFRSQDWG